MSVVIPAYNSAAYIGETLASVFAQTFLDYEVIVVNDGSHDTPDLERVLGPYRHRIVYIVQENGGPSAAFNTGIRAARSPMVAFLASDDVWEPDYLAVQLSILHDDPTIDVLYPDALVFGEAVEAGRTFMDLCPSRGDVTFERLVTLECHVMAAAVARRDMLFRVGLYDETLRSAEDFDLWLRILKAGGRIAYHRRVLIRYRRHAGSLSSDPVWMFDHVLRVLDKAERTMTLTPREAEAVSRTRSLFHAALRFQQGKKAFFHGDSQTAAQALREANRFFRQWRITLIVFLLRLAPGLLRYVYRLRDRHIFRVPTTF